jgi:septum formation topological specificity factor MinE
MMSFVESLTRNQLETCAKELSKNSPQDLNFSVLSDEELRTFVLEAAEQKVPAITPASSPQNSPTPPRTPSTHASTLTLTPSPAPAYVSAPAPAPVPDPIPAHSITIPVSAPISIQTGSSSSSSGVESKSSTSTSIPSQTPTQTTDNIECLITHEYWDELTKDISIFDVLKTELIETVSKRLQVYCNKILLVIEKLQVLRLVHDQSRRIQEIQNKSPILFPFELRTMNYTCSDIVQVWKKVLDWIDREVLNIDTIIEKRMKVLHWNTQLPSHKTTWSYTQKLKAMSKVVHLATDHGKQLVARRSHILQGNK